MRPSRSLLLGVLALAGLAVVAGLAGSRRRPTSAADFRPSTFLAEPNGARAFADALDRLGVAVVKARVHQPSAWTADSGQPALVAILGPTLGISFSQRADFLALPDRGIAVLVAGSESRRLIGCLGYRVKRLADSALVDLPTPAGRRPSVAFVLVPSADSVLVDSAGMFDSQIQRCRVPSGLVVEPLLATAGGDPIAVRLVGSAGRGAVIVVSDVGLFRNRTLRDSDVGPTVLGWLAGHYDRIWFPEYLHGYLGGGSLLGWTVRWSRETPWGWAVWQLAVLGILALGAAMVRFGPPIPMVEGRRRSVAEQVGALARALEAAGGHRVAVGLVIGGLRRRLSPGVRTRGPWRPWVHALGGSTTNPKVVSLARQLETLDRPAPSEGDVLLAANLVEDLWTELRS